jgi:hypothetical protein
METAAVLYRHPELKVDWNQIHLCEVDARGFDGFSQELDAALQEVSPRGGFAGVFAGLDRIRTIPRWTLNDPVWRRTLRSGGEARRTSERGIRRRDVRGGKGGSGRPPDGCGR